MKQIKRTTQLILGFTILIGFAISCGSSGGQKVIIEPEFGNMTLELYDSTPKHRDNFIKLVGEKYYDDRSYSRYVNPYSQCTSHC